MTDSRETDIVRLEIIAREINEGLPQDATSEAAVRQAADTITTLRQRVKDLEDVLTAYPLPPKQMADLKAYLRTLDDWREDRRRALGTKP